MREGLESRRSAARAAWAEASGGGACEPSPPGARGWREGINAMANLLEGNAALITGCSSGIGRATALAFGRAGAIVTCADVDQKGGDATVALIREAHGKADFVQADVT